MNLRAAAALALACSLAGCAGAPRARVVEARGWAPVGAGGVPAARALALADAQRRAAEQAAGVTVSARTSVRRGVAVDQRLESRALGVLERYEVEGESVSPEGVSLRLRAWVKARAAGGSPAEGLSAAVTEPALAAPLARRGWRLAGAGEPADVVLSARATGEPRRDPLVRPLESWRARVAVEARAADGTLLWSGEESAAALAAAAEDARRDAEARAYELAAAAASEQLPEVLWAKAR